jgi:hypothetical protein
MPQQARAPINSETLQHRRANSWASEIIDMPGECNAFRTRHGPVI